LCVWVGGGWGGGVGVHLREETRGGGEEMSHIQISHLQHVRELCHFWKTHPRVTLMNDPSTWHDFERAYYGVGTMSRIDAWHDSFTCVTWLIYMRDMTHLSVWRDSFTSVTWLTLSLCLSLSLSLSCVTWLTYMCDETHLHVWNGEREREAQRESLLWDKMRDMTHLYVWRDSFTRVTWLTYMCDMTHMTHRWVLKWFRYMRDTTRNNSRICVTWLTDESWNDSHICVTRLTWLEITHVMRDMTHRWVLEWLTCMCDKTHMTRNNSRNVWHD